MRKYKKDKKKDVCFNMYLYTRKGKKNLTFNLSLLPDIEAKQTVEKKRGREI